MEISEPPPNMPLDFSLAINFKLNGISSETQISPLLSSQLNNNNNTNHHNNNNTTNNNNNNSTSSAFKVVTPRGKTDGKLSFPFFFQLSHFM